MRALVAGLILVSASAHAALDLKTYVQKAVDNSPQVKTSEFALQSAELDQTNAHQFFLPRLDLTSTIGKQETSPIPASVFEPDTSQLTLGLSSTLLDSWNSIYRWNQTDVKVRQARLDLQKSRDSVALDAIKRFLQFSQSSLNDQIQRESYRILEKQANLVSSQYRQGMRTRKDDLRFQSQLRSSELNLASSEGEISKSRNALRELDPSVNVDEVQIEKPHADLKKESIRIISVEEHRDKKLIELGQEVRGYQYDIDRKRLGPDLNVKVSTNYNMYNFTTPHPNETKTEDHNWNALLTVQWNLIDWGERRRQNEILLNQNRTQDQSDESTLRKLARDLTDLGVRATQARKSVQISGELLGMEESSYRQLEADYREGKATYLDLITALQDLTTARRQSSDSQYDWMNIRYESLYHEGRLYEEVTR